MTKQHLYALGILAVLLVVTAGGVYVVPQLFDTGRCLNENEEARYEVVEKGRPGIVQISVFDTVASTTVWSREITHPTPGIVHPVGLGKCYAYLPQSFHYDWEAKEPLKGYSFEIWQFPYFSKNYGESVVVAAQSMEGGMKGYESYYSGTSFDVDPFDKYLVLKKSLLGQSGYSLVVKNLNTKEDMFTLSMRDLHTANSNVYGTLGLIDWTDDGRYFWADLADGAYEIAWIRVDTTDWSYDVYEAPEGILGGHPLDVNTGWVTLVPGTFWTGVAQDTDDIRRERLVKGQTTSSLYLYNLFTQEKLLVQTFNDPVWDGWPHKWLNERTLQYTMPNGEARTYTLEK